MMKWFIKEIGISIYEGNLRKVFKQLSWKVTISKNVSVKCYSLGKLVSLG